MDDLISREPLELARAIDGLTEWQKHVQTDSNINRDITIAIEALKAQLKPCEDAVRRKEVLNCLEWQYSDKLPRTKIMELQPVTPKQRWIPVTERLPEESGLYQVTDIQGNVVRYVFNANESSVEYWRRCVKAWMPLPKPWEGDAE